MALIKCSECGSGVSEKASMCPKCGCPIDILKEIISTKKRKKTKKIIIGIIGLVIVTIIAIVILRFINHPNADGYYQNTQWGMSLEQVQKELGEEAFIIEETESVYNTINDYEGKTGISAMIICDCTDNLLKKITLYLSNEDNSPYTDLELLDEYTTNFEALYGKAENDLCSTFWTTPKSRIKLSYLMDKVILITYEDITTVEK